MSRRTSSPRLLLEDMLRYCDYVRDFTQDLVEAEFLENVQAQFAVVRAVEVLGEAAKRLLDFPQEDNSAITALPLREMYATRNRLIHGYDTVDPTAVWQICHGEVAQLRSQIAFALQSLQHTPGQSGSVRS